MTDPHIFENKKAAYFTLGCKLNFAETSALGRTLFELGVRRVREGEEADICVINTCSVTEAADKKCRTLIRRAVRDYPRAFIVVTGCYAQLKPEEIAAIEGVDLVLGAKEKPDLPAYINALEKRSGAARIAATERACDILTFSPGCSSDDRTRHFLKVQDGCNYRCSYCTIPAARGPSRNGSIASLAAQARRAADEGGREIVLTGVNIGDFGHSTGERLPDLLEALDKIDGIERYRISSIEPNLLSDELIDFVAESRRFAPHFHLPLQSGSDEVLRLMRRRYDTGLFRARIEHIRRRMPRAFIGIDVIVGTRGETEALFDDGCAFLESIPFSALHVFTYSERPGTAALDIPHRVDVAEKHRRSNRLLSLSEERTAAFTRQGVGAAYRVIWESRSGDTLMEGYTENYLRAAMPYRPDAVGTPESVTAVAYDAGGRRLLCETETPLRP